VSDGNRKNAAEGPYYLSVRIGLITLGLILVALAMLSKGGVIVIVAILAGVVIQSAFSRFPAVVVSYVRSKGGQRYETLSAIALPLALAIILVWMVPGSIDTARILGRWVDVAAAIIFGIGALMNLAVLVLNLLSLRRR